jgi:hypothetical protein
VAYKRKTTKTGPNSRSSTTTNTKGPSTFSNSTTHNGVTNTQTSKNGKYYTTQTVRKPDGSVERKRIQSSQRKADQSGDGFGGVLILIVGLVIFGLLFGG